MKKYIFMAAALMMMGMGMSSCSNNDEINEVEQAPKKVQLTLTASFDMGGESRADWDADGVTPKFATGDKVGVYSDNCATVEQLDVTVDAEGNATLTGSVTEATEYHLVFPYQAGTTYNSGTKQITGFAEFTKQEYNSNYGTPVYPRTALHYVKVTGSATEATFKPLCAILRTAYDEAKEWQQVSVFVRVANVTSPVINITNEGATVTATAKTFVHPTVNLSQFNMSISGGLGQTICWPVAPGTVKLTQGYLHNLDDPFGVKTGTVNAGKIYNINISNY